MKRKENSQKDKKCKACGTNFKPFSSLNKYCSFNCAKSDTKVTVLKHKKPIRAVSTKRAKENKIYSQKRKEFLSLPENQVCFIENCYNEADTIEHTMGRKGYADQWAKDNNISLFLDERFWKPCCCEHNLELERNSELSKKYQLSKITGKPKS